MSEPGGSEGEERWFSPLTFLKAGTSPLTFELGIVLPTLQQTISLS